MAENKRNIFARIPSFFKEAKSDFKKIAWPTREQTVKNTITVLISILVSAAVLYALDFMLKQLIGFILNLK